MPSADNFNILAPKESGPLDFEWSSFLSSLQTKSELMGGMRSYIITTVICLNNETRGPKNDPYTFLLLQLWILLQWNLSIVNTFGTQISVHSIEVFTK